VSNFAPGESVQTPLGKGIVRETRRNGRLLVEINGRAVVLDAIVVARIDTSNTSARKKRAPQPAPASSAEPQMPRASAEVDLHGLTVEEALARAERHLNDALLGDLSELRLIHGKGSGRIRAALHRRLGEISAVRAYRLDPRNPGVTIVNL
jgi:DNA mismatch repair protein MutS2